MAGQANRVLQVGMELTENKGPQGPQEKGERRVQKELADHPEFEVNVDYQGLMDNQEFGVLTVKRGNRV